MSGARPWWPRVGSGEVFKRMILDGDSGGSWEDNWDSNDYHHSETIGDRMAEFFITFFK